MRSHINFDDYNYSTFICIISVRADVICFYACSFVHIIICSSINASKIYYGSFFMKCRTAQ